MIKRRTVLILGAGASVPYGFPVGRQLLFKVVKGLTPAKQPIFQNLTSCGFEQSRMSEFRDQLQRSQQPSVDAFLEHRNEFLDVGKAAIAAALIPYEEEGNLLPAAEQRWYEYLFEHMRAKPEHFRGNRLSIVTFNYDRSFEWFLFLALKNSYGLNDGDTVSLLSRIPIIHVHGQLGGMPWDALGRPYEPALTPETVQQAAADIRIIHESPEVDPEFGKARDLLSAAQRICFLGFGYHEENIRRLQLNDLEGSVELLGSAYDMRQAEQDRVKKIIRRRIKLGDPEFDALGLLRAYPVLV